MKGFLVLIWILCFRSLRDYSEEVADIRPSDSYESSMIFPLPEADGTDCIRTVNGWSSSGIQEVKCPAVHISLD